MNRTAITTVHLAETAMLNLTPVSADTLDGFFRGILIDAVKVNGVCYGTDENGNRVGFSIFADKVFAN